MFSRQDAANTKDTRKLSEKQTKDKIIDNFDSESKQSKKKGKK